MSKITLVTGIGPGCWESYAHRTLPEMRRCWDADRFVLYAERGCPVDLLKVTHPWEIRFADEVLGFHDFQIFCARSPVRSGRQKGSGHRWKPREEQLGYCYRYDAAKFSKMAMYVADAARRAEDGILVWLDADVMTYRVVPRSLIGYTLAGDADVAYLGRRSAHSETGFAAFSIPAGRPIAETWGEVYRSQSVFSLPEWHSAYVFDVAVERYAKAPRDLTPGGTGHVWFRGPFRNYADHLKGNKRKEQGFSEEWEKNAGRRLGQG